MHVVEIDQRARLRAYFQRRAGLHLYELGDLDDFFWPHTRWFGLDDDGHELRAVVLVYASPGLPTVMALGDPEELPALAELLSAIRTQLPARFHGHLSPGLVDALEPHDVRDRRGLIRMMLTDRSALGSADLGTVRLGVEDRDELAAFYARSYSDNWFDARMLETGQYVGILDPQLIAAAGIHVYSPAEGVAALGNIAVAPDRRGEGLGQRVTAAVSRALTTTVDTIGLNVRADNTAAIRCYTRLGFTPIAAYDEWVVTMTPVTSEQEPSTPARA